MDTNYYRLEGGIGNLCDKFEYPIAYIVDSVNVSDSIICKISSIAQLILLGIPALILKGLSRLIYSIKGERIKKESYEESRKLWNEKVKNIEDKVADLFIKNRISTENCPYDRVLILDYQAKGRGVTYLFEPDGKFSSIPGEIEQINKILVLIKPKSLNDNKSFKEYMDVNGNKIPTHADIKKYYENRYSGKEKDRYLEIYKKCTFHWLEPNRPLDRSLISMLASGN